MAGRHRLLIGAITQGKARGKDLIKAIGDMNKTGTASYEELASGVKKSKPKKGTVLKVGLLLIGMALGGVFFASSSHVSAAPSAIGIQTSASATTSVAYMTAGTASSTYQIDSNGAFASSQVPNMQQIDAVDVNIQYAASSTSAILIVTPQWSNNNVDWYGFAQPTNASVSSTGVSFLATTTLTYQYLPSSTATSSIVIALPVVNEQHERLIYGTQGGNGAVYSEYDLKQNGNTP